MAILNQHSSIVLVNSRKTLYLGLDNLFSTDKISTQSTEFIQEVEF